MPTTPARHGALLRCLAALATQTLPRESYEVVVVPNGPGAEAAPPVDADRTLVVPRPSAARARNAGAREARAPLVVFVDDDVEVAPGCLQAHLAAFTRTGGVTLGPYWPEPDASPAGRIATRWWREHFARAHAPGHVPSFVDFITGNTGVPRAALAATGGFDESFPGAHREDWELGVRLRAAGVPFTAVPGAQARHHHAMTVGKYLRDRRMQGAGDLLLVARHPATWANLTLARVAPLRARRGPWAVLVGAGRLAGRRKVPGAIERLARAFDRVGLPRLAERVVHAAAVAAYCAGVDHGVRRGLDAVGRPHTTVLDLSATEPLDVGPALGDVQLRHGGRVIGRVRLPGGQWDGALVRRSALAALARDAARGRAA